ncbi:MAG TPA: CRTAC1 family protein [Thermoanaerobaculia bacterium]|nr:CRTAC1 family protein [Thermoanaerobaculia bacterium]
MRTPRALRSAVLVLGAAVMGPVVGLAPAAPSGPLRFADAAERWGIVFRHHHGGTGEFYMPETMGSGVAIFDYDRDGDQDVLLIDSGTLPLGSGEPSRSVLLRNDGGRFVDVTAVSGVKVTGYGMGAVAADVDGDGDLDLYITSFGANQLLLNQGDGTFTDVSSAAGVADPLWSSSAAFADVDGDGDLDLYVANYVDFAIDRNEICGKKERGLRSYCHPNVYRGLPDRFYRNRGDGTFEDASEPAGISGPRGNGMGVVASDLDGDGWIDFYVANDMTANLLWRNRGDGTFEELALLAGAAFSDRGEPEAGMGVAAGDLDGDGRFELMTTHLDQQTNALYGNVGPGLFVDRRFLAGLAEPSVPYVGFGVVFADLDADGDLDVVVANGHIIHNVEQVTGRSAYRQRNQVFLNDGAGRFTELEGSGLDRVASSRGLAAGDLDGDGDLDLVVNNSNDLAEAWENLGPRGRFLEVALESAQDANRFAVGARVELLAESEPGARSDAPARRQVREVRAGGSYQSASQLPLHFGLGEARRATLRVRWPRGGWLEVRQVPAERRVVVRRGAGL